MYLDLGKPIAVGRTAEIYAWQDNQVLKLFYDWFDLDSIKYEAHVSRVVHAAGLSVPAVGEVLRVNDHNALVYQRVDGVMMWDMLKRKPWKGNHYACRLAELQAQMHTSTIQVDIPGQRQRLRDRITHAGALTGKSRAKALAALEAMPDGDRLCHGDFHPGNVLITPQAEILIDWIDATRGNPLSDVARTTILIRGAAATNQIGNFVEKVFVHIFHATYLRHYFRLHPGGEDEYVRWLPIMAAARLSENIPEVEKWLVAQMGKHL